MSNEKDKMSLEIDIIITLLHGKSLKQYSMVSKIRSIGVTKNGNVK